MNAPFKLSARQSVVSSWLEDAEGPVRSVLHPAWRFDDLSGPIPMSGDGGTMFGGCTCAGCTLTGKELKAEVYEQFGLQRSSISFAEGPQFLGDDIGDNTSSTTSIAVGGTLNSSIQHSGDLDYIRVSLEAGQTYVFSLAKTPAGLNDPYLELRTSTNVLVAEDDDGGILLNSFLVFRPTQSGDYFIVARGYDGTSVGGYSLSVDTIENGNSSPTAFPNNGKPLFSWEEAGIHITRTGSSWSQAFGQAAVVTYAYRSTAPAQMPEDTAGFSRLNSAQIAAAEAALAAWAAVANVTFVRVDDGDGYSNNASILFGNYDTGVEGAAAFAFLPVSGNAASSSVQGDIWINVSLDYNANPVVGDFGAHALLHEIGHALGLSHPGDYSADPTYNVDAVYFSDSRMFTALSYFGSSNTGGNLPAFASIPQLHDIAAIQRLYGANMATRTGDTIYGFNSNTGVPEYSLTLASQGAVFAIWDGGGLDTLDLSGYSTDSTIDLREEAFSSAGPGDVGLAVFNISIARGASIENAKGGAGNDTIIGNAADNTLTGNGGNDVLNGMAGADTMIGGAGMDEYHVDSAGDAVVETDGGLGDRVVSSISYTLGANFENLTLTGAATNGTGNAAANEIIGNDLANFIDGKGGADSMHGGGGDDVIVVDHANDFVMGDAGFDIVEAHVSWTVNGQIEEVRLMGAALNATGGGDGERLIGNALANVLTGNGGADYLDGGAGVDKLLGGDGNDRIVWDAADDLANVLGGAGTDTLVFTGAAPTTFNLATHQFEKAETTINDAGGQTWSSIIRVYDTQWLLDTETTNFDNGSWAFHDFDQTSQFVWSDEWTLRDALNRVDVIVTTFDDGSYSNNNLDQDDSFVWSSEWTRYTAADEVDTIVTTFDDNTKSINEFDVAGAQPWITQWTHYDALDRADIVVTTFDDASYSINELDVADVQSWATQWTRYDALDRVDTVVTTFDDGTYAILDLDQEDAFDWASQWWLYNADDEVIQYELIPDGSGLSDEPALIAHTAAPLAILGESAALTAPHWAGAELLSASALAGAGFSWRADWAFVDAGNARSAGFDADAFLLAAGPRPLGPSVLWDAMLAAHASAGGDAAPAVLPQLADGPALFAFMPFAADPHLTHDQLIMAA